MEDQSLGVPALRTEQPPPVTRKRSSSMDVGTSQWTRTRRPQSVERKWLSRESSYFGRSTVLFKCHVESLRISCESNGCRLQSCQFVFLAGQRCGHALCGEYVDFESVYDLMETAGHGASGHVEGYGRRQAASDFGPQSDLWGNGNYDQRFCDFLRTDQSQK